MKHYSIADRVAQFVLAATLAGAYWSTGRTGVDWWAFCGAVGILGVLVGHAWWLTLAIIRTEMEK